MTDKVIALIDMDCFYVQVEAREDTSLQGVPAAVCQYNSWKGGGIIAVNYEARACGVTRQMRGNQAAEKCPDIRLVTVPEHRDKSDLTKYRKAGREVIEVLLSFGCVVERASIDEAYLDLTELVNTRLQDMNSDELVDVNISLPNTHIGGMRTNSKEERIESVKNWIEETQLSGNDPDRRLAIGGAIVEEIRAAVHQRTKFRCSAGIGHCKTLAKLCCGLNKPNKQTVLPLSAVPILYADLPLHKVRGLGGLLGDRICDSYDIKDMTMGQLAEKSSRDLVSRFEEKTGAWLFHLCKGFDNEEVSNRNLAKSIGCSKNFLGPDILDTKEKVEIRLRNLVEEVVERLEVDKEDHKRIARGICIGGKLEGSGYMSRGGPLPSYAIESLYRTAFSLLSKLNTTDKASKLWRPRLLNLSLSISKFEDLSVTGTKEITTFFKKATMPTPTDTSLVEAPLQVHYDRVNSYQATTEPDNDTEYNAPSTSKQNDNSTYSDSETQKPSNPEFGKSGNIEGKSADIQKPANTKTVEKPAKVEDKESGESKIEEPPPVQTSYFKRIMQEMKEKEDAEKRAAAEEAARAAELAAEEEAARLAAEEEASNSTDEEPEEQNRTSQAHQRTGEEQDNLGIDICELIPNLENFDPQILGLLPPKVRKQAQLHVETLKKKQKIDKLLGNNRKNMFSKSSSDSKQRNSSPRVASNPPRVVQNPPREGRISPEAFCISSNAISSLKGAVGSLTGAVGSLTGAAGSLTGAVGSLTEEFGSPAGAFINSEARDSNWLDLQKCDECQEMISAYEMPEHLDFHFAKNILKEERRQNASVKTADKRQRNSSGGKGAAQNKSRGGKATGSKRKRTSESSTAEAMKKSHIDISSFFKKS